MTRFADCTFCGGDVEERQIEYDYRRKGQLLVVNNVPTGVCQQCGEKYFTPDVLKKMDELYHNIFDYHKEAGADINRPSCLVLDSSW